MTGALWEFAQLVKSGDQIEYHACSDGSAGITAIRDNMRVATIAVAAGESDGVVYDLPKIAGRGYIVYPPKEAKRWDEFHG